MNNVAKSTSHSKVLENPETSFWDTVREGKS